MGIYLILIIIILLLGLGIKPGMSQERNKFFLALCFVILVIISGFRDYSVGVDTKTYVYIYRNIEHIGFGATRYETGFLYFTKLIHTIFEDPTALLLISSIICIGCTCRFIYSFSYDPLLSILLYVVLKPYFFQMTGIRQALSTAFIMESYRLIMNERSKRRVILSTFLLILSISFHYISIVAIIPYMILLSTRMRDRLFNSPSTVLKRTILLCLIVFVFYSYILRLVTIVAPQYTYYFNSIWGESNYFASLFSTLIQLVFLIVGTYYLNRSEEVENESFALLMISLSIIIYTLSMRMEIWSRLAPLFSIYTGIMFAPMFTSTIENWKNRTILKTTIFLFSFTYMLVTFIFRPEWDGVVPYLFK